MLTTTIAQLLVALGALPSLPTTRRQVCSAAFATLVPCSSAIATVGPSSSMVRVQQRTISEVVREGTLGPMARWPDPMLRKEVAAVPTKQFGPELAAFAEMLVDGMESKAIAASQYGVNAQVIALKGESSPSARGEPFVVVNPRIIERSPESSMVPWREICLVLPPGLEVDLLRDAYVTIEGEDVHGVTSRRTLRGEPARAFQHEYDHLRGVLIIDHASLDELPPYMRAAEQAEHKARQQRAFARGVIAPSPVTPKPEPRRAPPLALSVLAPLMPASAASPMELASPQLPSSMNEGATIRSLYAPVKARNTQLAAALVLPLLAYKAGAVIQKVQLQWYLDATIALAAVALLVYALK